MVLANGVFDLFHVGHARYLFAASVMGDALHVAVTADAFVNKGEGRPVYTAQERCFVVGSMGVVDEAYIVQNVLEAFEQSKPDIFVKGREYEGKIEPIHADYCRAHGIEIRFTDTETVRPRDRLRAR